MAASNNRKSIYMLTLTALFAAIIVLMSFTPIGYIPLGVINATLIHIPVILGSIYLGPVGGAFLGFVFGLTSFLKNTYMPATLSAFVFSPVLAAQTIGPEGILYSTIICFVPRILVGVIPYFVFKGIVKGTSSANGTFVKSIFSVILGFILFAGLSQYLLRLGTPEIAAWLIAAVVGVAVVAALLYVGKKSSLKALPYMYAGITGALTNTLLVMPMIYIFYREPYAIATNVSPDALLSVILGIIAFNGVMEAIVAAVIIGIVGSALSKVRGINPYSRENKPAKEKA